MRPESKAVPNGAFAESEGRGRLACLSIASAERDLGDDFGDIIEWISG